MLMGCIEGTAMLIGKKKKNPASLLYNIFIRIK